MTTVLAAIGAFGSMMAGIAAVIAVVRAGRIHEEVRTGNGRSLGLTVAAGSQKIEETKDQVTEIRKTQLGEDEPSSDPPPDPSALP